MTIGIPKALFYWKHPHFWETFFENLGAKVVLSPETNKEIVEIGTKFSDPETCFSIKVFFGHLLYLDQKCDYIFVPRLKTNREKLEYCPKFFALPDLARIFVKTPILTEVFDERKEKFEKTLERLGRRVANNKKLIKKAKEVAFLKQKELKEKQKNNFFKKIKFKRQKILLISHQYNLYDDYVNLGIKGKLEKLKAETIFVDEVPIDEIPNSKFQIPNKGQIKNIKWPKFHWEFGKEIKEKIETILNYNISGAIEISAFQCGCDAVLKEFVEKEFKINKVPFLYLIVDEQTGEAGIQTRIEAFIDTIGK
ncbi:hypothetical protein J7K44_00415 [bacterium]|nr:hypothetical protein [bacterium]